MGIMSKLLKNLCICGLLFTAFAACSAYAAKPSPTAKKNEKEEPKQKNAAPKDEGPVRKGVGNAAKEAPMRRNAPSTTVRSRSGSKNAAAQAAAETPAPAAEPEPAETADADTDDVGDAPAQASVPAPDYGYEDDAFEDDADVAETPEPAAPAVQPAAAETALAAAPARLSWCNVRRTLRRL